MALEQIKLRPFSLLSKARIRSLGAASRLKISTVYKSLFGARYIRLMDVLIINLLFRFSLFVCVFCFHFMMINDFIKFWSWFTLVMQKVIFIFAGVVLSIQPSKSLLGDWSNNNSPVRFCGRAATHSLHFSRSAFVLWPSCATCYSLLLFPQFSARQSFGGRPPSSFPLTSISWLS